jgi:nucleoside phosphorylase
MQSRSARHQSRQWRSRVAVAVLVLSLAACGEGTVNSGNPPSKRFAVLSTFPAEMAPLLGQMTVDHTEVVNGRSFRIGTLAGVPVVLGITGIGLVNAATTTNALLDRFDVAGVVLSAVAGGSTQQLGDVAVPGAFELKNGTTYAVTREWLALVRTIATAGSVLLDQCTVIADPPPTDPVCMPQPPAIIVGGVGMSSDPYGGKPFACIQGGNDLYGCDLPSPAPADPAAGVPRSAVLETAVDAATPVTQDMETAAIVQVTLVHGLPFIGFRAVSDGGTGDSLGLVGFLPQFSAYYRFAARNAAAAAAAFLKEVAAPHR